MDINLKVTLTNGKEINYTSSDFPTIDACQEQVLRVVDKETGSLTLNEPDGSRIVMPARHIVAVSLTKAALGGTPPAGDR